MMSVSRRSCVVRAGLGEQLRGVAHRADRVADFVRDARAQAAERCQFRLLDALGDQGRVLEKDQRRSALARSSDTKCGCTRLPPSEDSSDSELSCQS